MSEGQFTLTDDTRTAPTTSPTSLSCLLQHSYLLQAAATPICTLQSKSLTKFCSMYHFHLDHPCHQGGQSTWRGCATYTAGVPPLLSQPAKLEMCHNIKFHQTFPHIISLGFALIEAIEIGISFRMLYLWILCVFWKPLNSFFHFDLCESPQTFWCLCLCVLCFGGNLWRFIYRCSLWCVHKHFHQACVCSVWWRMIAAMCVVVMTQIPRCVL